MGANVREDRRGGRRLDGACRARGGGSERPEPGADAGAPPVEPDARQGGKCGEESGESGALSLKIDAAKACNIPILILEKPSLPVEFRIVKNKQNLSKVLVGMNLKTASIK